MTTRPTQPTVRSCLTSSPAGELCCTSSVKSIDDTILELDRVTRGLGGGIRDLRQIADDPAASAEVLCRRLTMTGRQDGCVLVQHRGLGPARTALAGFTAVNEGRDQGCERDRGLLGGLDAGRFVPAPLKTATCRVAGAGTAALLGDICRVGRPSKTGGLDLELHELDDTWAVQLTVKGDPVTWRP